MLTLGYLNTPEKQCRRLKLKSRAEVAEQKVQKVLGRMEKLVKSQGQVVNDSHHNDFREIMEENNGGVCDAFPEGSFRRLSKYVHFQ